MCWSMQENKSVFKHMANFATVSSSTRRATSRQFQTTSLETVKSLASSTILDHWRNNNHVKAKKTIYLWAMETKLCII